jgi:hypothetical protein
VAYALERDDLAGPLQNEVARLLKRGE